ncbi:MAG: Asp-tRNA(Asn)/Glu-tRNA(Gln) amidotransferase subunit GatC [Patescibacteria group bacterium]
MIEKKDIEKLATLSRMKLSEEEKDRFAKEIDSILGYVKQIQDVSSVDSALAQKMPTQYPRRNALREDVDNRDIIDDTSVLINLAPASQDGYVKVKKILG